MFSADLTRHELGDISELASSYRPKLSSNSRTRKSGGRRITSKSFTTTSISLTTRSVENWYVVNSKPKLWLTCSIKYPQWTGRRDRRGIPVCKIPCSDHWAQLILCRYMSSKSPHWTLQPSTSTKTPSSNTTTRAPKYRPKCCVSSRCMRTSPASFYRSVPPFKIARIRKPLYRSPTTSSTSQASASSSSGISKATCKTPVH